MLWTCYGISNVLSVGGTVFFCRRKFLASSKGNRTVYILYWVCALNSSLIEKCRDLICRDLMCAAILVWRQSVSFYLNICRFLCRFFYSNFSIFFLLTFISITFLLALFSIFFLLVLISILFLLALFYLLLTRAFLSPSYSHFFIPILLYLLLYLHSFLAPSLFAFFSFSYSIFTLFPPVLYTYPPLSRTLPLFLSHFFTIWHDPCMIRALVHSKLICTIINRICNELPV